MVNNFKTPYQLLKSHFKIKSLNGIYNEKFSSSTTKGIDRVSGIQFKKQSKLQIKVINKKCLKGTYKFSPYLELLQSKGRGKAPRILAIPTIRDRIVLHALKDILCQIFPECVPRKLANTYIYEVKDFVSNRPPEEVGVLRADLENFYGSIDREKLFNKLRAKIKSLKILTLIKKAIETPVVSKTYHRKDLKKFIEESPNKGVPQGLSISNILASIYLHEFDNDMQDNSYIDVYYRYVDDILIFTKKEKIDEIEDLFKEKIKLLNLKLNTDKTYKIGGEKEFEYLGYRFELPKVTIKSSTIEKFIHSVVAKFSNYIHNNKKKLKKLKKAKYNVEDLKNAFVLDLNEKITGAVSEKKKYGWIFYFNAINELSVLYMIDNIIANLFKRLDDFNRVPPPNLKKISRAFYEAKHNPRGGYIHNYNNYETVEQKRDFLRERGELERNKGYSEKEINELYENLKQKNLSELEKDDALLY